jgi:anti-sigma B factor antagonist
MTESAGLHESDQSRERVRPAAAYSIRDAAADGAVVLVLEGELDIASTPVLRARVDEVNGGDLVLDFRRATFIDSAVLKELLRARAEFATRGARLVLVGVPPPIRRLLDLTRTSELFDDAPDVETALRQLNA